MLAGGDIDEDREKGSARADHCQICAGLNSNSQRLLFWATTANSTTPLYTGFNPISLPQNLFIDFVHFFLACLSVCKHFDLLERPYSRHDVSCMAAGILRTSNLQATPCSATSEVSGLLDYASRASFHPWNRYVSKLGFVARWRIGSPARKEKP